MTKRILVLAILLTIFGTGFAHAQDNDSILATVRADFRADKTALITEAMQFTDTESKVFWPVYRKYEGELSAVNDQRVALIKSYAEKWTTMTDADAKAMLDKSLAFETSRTELKKKYAKTFQSAGLSAMTTAKFFQLEHRLDLLVDLKIASELPGLFLKAPATK